MTKITLVKKIPGSKIAAMLPCGSFMVLNHVFASRDDQKLFDTLEKVRLAMQIDLRHWRPAKSFEI